MSTIRHPLRVSWLALVVAGLCLLTSCGGGVGGQASNTGNGSGVGSGGTGSYTNGPISGLGSIIVNGVRYDVSNAKVLSDEAESALPAALNLGMQVEVSGGAVTPSSVQGAYPTAVATEVRFASALVGKVSAAPDATCHCMTVLGQTVTYNDSTNMPAGLSTSDVVEVFGQADLTQGVLVATRVQRVTSGTPRSKLVGWVASSASIKLSDHTLTVRGPTQNLTVAFTEAQLGQLTPLMDDDMHRSPVRVWMTGEASSLMLDHVSIDKPLVSDRDEARLEGLVSSVFNATTRHMSIHGTLVDATTATAEDQAKLAALRLGDRVRVDGKLVAGLFHVEDVYTAGSSEVDDEHDIELHGYPEAAPVAVDGTRSTITLRGVVVIYKNVDVALDLSKLPCVEVEGKAYDGSGRLVADEIKADTGCHR